MIVRYSMIATINSSIMSMKESPNIKIGIND